MGLRISTNVASIAAQRHLTNSQRTVENAMKQLSSGDKFAAPGADAAGFAISERLRGQISGQKAAKGNAENALGFIQVAEGGLNEQHNILIRMRELAIQAASDTYSNDERGFINDEFQQLISEFDRIARTTQFGSSKLLMGDGKEMEFHVGAYGGPENIVKFTTNANTTAASVGLDGMEVSSKSEARSTLKDIDKAITDIAGTRATFGAIQSRLTSVSNNASVQIENLTNAHSKLADADVAEAIANMTKGQVQQQFQLAVLSQANALPTNVLKLVS